ncbi:DNA-binding protein [Cohnella sp. AR92]|uniref:DNA-binding protein n=1 Tax=Cohnella sp. AR92 TaxID=648716 RepID=UPI000F8D7674|nr:DNA-binding protein [Cohnella sp. AR92]RUS47927.1 DNA-binding protein [Cohnella sp. AR92]
MSRIDSPWPAKLARPAIRALANAGIAHLEQLTLRSETELLALHGMGPKALDLLRQELSERGLSFRET